jgi:HK97 family phage prohead protease
VLATSLLRELSVPLPKPKKGEQKDDWLDRCMGNDTMNTEFPDNGQRYKVCNQIWKDKDKKSKEDETMKEYRFLPVTELRADTDEDGVTKLTGYAAVFNKLSEPLGGFREKIAPGAFKNSIKDGDVRALWNHDTNLVLGRTTSGTLALKEDKKGLHVEIEPPNTRAGQDAVESIKRGDVNQMSFGFITISDEWNVHKEENIRTLIEVDLFDVSPVTFPAYPQTKISARSLKTAGINVEDIAKVMIRREHSLELSEVDVGIVEDTIKVLSEALPVKPEDEDVTNDDSIENPQDNETREKEAGKVGSEEQEATAEGEAEEDDHTNNIDILRKRLILRNRNTS